MEDHKPSYLLISPLVCLLSVSASAQTSPATTPLPSPAVETAPVEMPTAAPAPEVSSTTEVAPASDAVPTEQAPPVVDAVPIACVPACRDGFVCHEGKCISACNPPCEDGTQCTAAGQCVIPPYITQHWQLMPPPTYPPVAAAPRVSGPKRMPSSFRLFANFDLLPVGTGTITEINTDTDMDYDYDVSFGASVGAEIRFGKFFGLGMSPRYFTSKPSGYSSTDAAIDNVDIVLLPTARFALGMVEFVVPLDIGLAMQIPPGDSSTGYGLVVGVNPGAIFWLTPMFGLNVNVGYEEHIVMGDQSYGGASFLDSDPYYINVYYMLHLTAGVSFGI